jgi:hypothetical protein
MPNQRQYSRLAKVEEGRQLRTAVKFVILTVGLIAFLGFLGIPLLVKVVEIATNREAGTSINPEDTTPPAPPRIAGLPEYTKENEIKIEGNTESGATVILHLNQEIKELLADAGGNFSTRMNLDDGENKIFAISIDTNGNESLQSKDFLVTFDNQEPKVEVLQPKQGETLSGSKQKQISVEGTTENGVQMTINGRVVIVSGDGKFNYPTSLNEGENNFNIKATDRAGNMTELDVKATYIP